METRDRIKKWGRNLMLGWLIFGGCVSFGASERCSMSLYAVKYGESLYPASHLLGGDTSGKRLPIAWMFYAVKADGEIILVDTGFSDTAEAKHNEVTLLPYQPALAALGITTNSVTKIVLTHTHSDHAANVPLYPNATVVVNQREKDSVFLKTVGGDRLVTFDQSYEVVPGMTVRWVGGHTKGSSYVELKLDGKTYILAGDEAYLPENLSKLIPVGSVVDVAANLRFLTMAKNSGADVLTFHDPAVVKTGCVRQIAPVSEAAPPSVSDARRVVVAWEETDELLANPGMGWETFHWTSAKDKNLPSWLPSTVQYIRWGWRDLEPARGALNTNLLDRALRESHASGQTLAFRVMCCSPYAKPYHPAWLAEMGGRIYDADHNGRGPFPIPDMDDPVVLQAHLDFIKRLGARYDGHPDLDHVDLGSMGWWGEWHLSGSKAAKWPSHESCIKVVDAYLAAFRKTPLVMLLNGKDCAAYAIARGTGWRVDSMGDLGSFSPTWNHMRNAYPVWFRAAHAEEAWKTAPVAYEPPMGIDEFSVKKWPLRWIFNYALACHGSLFSGKSGKQPDDPLFRVELERFLKRLGYRLVLREACYPAAVGDTLDVAMKWQNVGSAPCYRPYRVAFRLTGTEGTSRTLVSEVTVNSWLPGSVDLFTEAFFKEVPDLPPGPVCDASAKLALPSDLPAGEYTVSIAVVDETRTPVVRLAVKGRAADGWYPLGQVAVRR